LLARAEGICALVSEIDTLVNSSPANFIPTSWSLLCNYVHEPDQPIWNVMIEINNLCRED
jgi:hypothetical protein